MVGYLRNEAPNYQAEGHKIRDEHETIEGEKTAIPSPKWEGDNKVAFRFFFWRKI